VIQWLRLTPTALSSPSGAEHRVVVSNGIKQEFENGKDYYRLDGGVLREPTEQRAKPSADNLEYHAYAVRFSVRIVPLILCLRPSSIFGGLRFCPKGEVCQTPTEQDVGKPPGSDSKDASKDKTDKQKKKPRGKERKDSPTPPQEKSGSNPKAG
jgi:hypothetical protein